MPRVSLVLAFRTGCPGPTMSPDSSGAEQLCRAEEGSTVPAARLEASATRLSLPVWAPGCPRLRRALGRAASTPSFVLPCPRAALACLPCAQRTRGRQGLCSPCTWPSWGVRAQSQTGSGNHYRLGLRPRCGSGLLREAAAADQQSSGVSEEQGRMGRGAGEQECALAPIVRRIRCSVRQRAVRCRDRRD